MIGRYLTGHASGALPNTDREIVGTMNRQRNRLTVKVPWLIELAAEGSLAIWVGSGLTIACLALLGRGMAWW